MLLTPSSEEERVTKISAKPSTIDKAVISQIESLSESYWQFLPAIANVVSNELLVLVICHLRSLQTLMSSELGLSTERRLCCVISTTAQVAGIILYAMKRHTEAEYCHNLAIEYAEKAGNHALWAVALGRMGNFLIDTGRAQTALNPLEAANRLAEGSATATIRSWLAASEAEAYANLGRGLDGDRAIGKAEDIAALMWPGQEPYRTLFDLPKLEAYKGACYVRLNRPRDASKAKVALNNALGQVDSTRPIEQSTLLRDLAIAHSLDKDIEHACQIASQALVLAHQTNSYHYAQRLQDFSERYLQNWKHVPIVRQFNQQLQATQHTFHRRAARESSLHFP